MANTLQDAQRLINKFGPLIVAMWGNKVDPAQIQISAGKLKPGTPAQGSYEDRAITFDTAFLKNATPEDFRGAVIHELAHAFGLGDGTKANVENLADATRYVLNAKDREDWTPNDGVLKIVERHGWTPNDPNPFAVQAAAQGITSAVWNVGTAVLDTMGGGGGTTEGGGGGGPLEGDTNNDGVLSLDEAMKLVNKSKDDSTSGPSAEEIAAAHHRRVIEKRRYERNATAGYNSLLTNYGIAMTPNLTQLVDEAVGRHYSNAVFMEYLRKTPEYHEEFRGIFEKDGTMRMTEAQYISTIKGYDAIATKTGIDLSKQDKVWAIRHDVTTTELAARAGAVSALNTNPALWNQFSREVVQGGLAAKGEVSRSDLLHFALNQDNQEWKDLWQDAATRYTATQAGLIFQKGAESYQKLRQAVIEHVSSLGLSEAEMAQKFQAVEQSLATDLADSRQVTHLGVTKKDIIKANFGGRGSGAARRLIERSQRNADSALDPRAENQAYATEGGLKTVGGSKKIYTG